MVEGSPRGPRRWFEIGFLAAVAAGLVYCGWGYWRDRELSRSFTRVQLGMDRGAVEALIGAPGWEGPCAGRIRYLPRAECSRELGYSSAFVPIRPDHYIVQLDRSGKVIESEPLRSR